MAEHEDLVLAIGPYLLGALDAETRTELRAHLETCDTCRRELVRLAGVPGLLAQASPPGLAGRGAPPAALRERLVRQVLDERASRERRQRALAIAAGFLLLLLPAGTFAALQVVDRPQVEVTAPADMTAATMEGDLVGQVSWSNHEWGSELYLVAEGLDPDERFLLMVEARDGRKERAATWEGIEGRVSAIGTTSIPESEIARVVVCTDEEEPKELLWLAAH